MEVAICILTSTIAWQRPSSTVHQVFIRETKLNPPLGNHKKITSKLLHCSQSKNNNNKDLHHKRLYLLYMAWNKKKTGIRELIFKHFKISKFLKFQTQNWYFDIIKNKRNNYYKGWQAKRNTQQISKIFMLLALLLCEPFFNPQVKNRQNNPTSVFRQYLRNKR